MVEEFTTYNAIFHALSHEARREMLGRLASQALTIGQLAEPFAMSLVAASKHVKVLQHAGLLTRTVEGRRHVCRLEPGPLAAATRWLSSYEGFSAARVDTPKVVVKDKPLSEEED